jgi:hypothetical protein
VAPVSIHPSLANGTQNNPEPLDPADLADAYWDLYLKRDRCEGIVGPAPKLP